MNGWFKSFLSSSKDPSPSPPPPQQLPDQKDANEQQQQPDQGESMMSTLPVQEVEIDTINNDQDGAKHPLSAAGRTTTTSTNASILSSVSTPPTLTADDSEQQPKDKSTDTVAANNDNDDDDDANKPAGKDGADATNESALKAAERKEADAEKMDTSQREIDFVDAAAQKETKKTRTLYRDVLRYVALAEETQNQKDTKRFTKDYNDEDVDSDGDQVMQSSSSIADKMDSDWRENHFLTKEDNSRDGHGVVVTSYQYDDMSEKINFCLPEADDKKLPALSNDGTLMKGDQDCGAAVSREPWLRIQNSSSCKPPELPSASDEFRAQFFQYFEHLKTEDSERFGGCSCDNLSDMIPLLEKRDIPSYESHGACGKVREWIASAMQYSAKRDMNAFYDDLFKWRIRRDLDAVELLIGFGHVRMTYYPATKPGKSTEKEAKTVNGPLFEVAVEVKLHEEHDEDGEDETVGIEVCPTNDARVTLNNEVAAALIANGGGNTKLIDGLHELAANQDVAALALDDPKSYRPFLKKAKLLGCGGLLRRAKDSSGAKNPSVHDIPDNPETLVVTDAWCMFSRKKISTPFSKDAYKVASALETGKLDASEPIRVLVGGAEYLASSGGEGISEDQLVYILPASEKQNEIGKKLFVQNDPISIVYGPPGTGKTHSIVNIAATALSVIKRVLITSSNTQSLKAFYDKLPPILKTLALNISAVQRSGEGMADFKKSLEQFIELWRDAEGDRNKIATLYEKRSAIMEQLHAIDEKLETAHAERTELLSDDNLKRVLDRAMKQVSKAHWIVKAALDAKLRDTVKRLDHLRADMSLVSFGDQNLAKKHLREPDFLECVKQKVHIAPISSDESSGAPSAFRFGTVLSEREKLLSSIQVDGKSPTVKGDWGLVLEVLKFRQDCIAPLLQFGCPEEDVYDMDGVSVHADFNDILEAGLELQQDLDRLPDDQKESMRVIFDTIRSIHSLQRERRELAAVVQSRDKELVSRKVIAALRERLDAKAIGVLETLCQKVEELAKTRGASVRSWESFTDSFKEAAKVMPFLIMTEEQVSTFLPVEHSFDIGILDEASQSNCRALLVMARCKQLLVVGDDKQVSPTPSKLSDEKLRWLEASLPKIDSKDRLLPDVSFFDCCKAVYAHMKPTYLVEHFRCQPGIIDVCNKLFYNTRLKPLRASSGARVLKHCYLANGVRDTKKKHNVPEAEFIANQIQKEIRNAAAGKSRNAAAGKSIVQTIGVISMGGKEQCDLIRELIEDRIDPLRIEFGTYFVERFDILVGVPAEFQGDERDTVFLSTVYGGVQNKAETPESQKSWNVAMSRAKNKMILVTSLRIADLKNKNDRRREYLRAFLPAEEALLDQKPAASLEWKHASSVHGKVESALVTALKEKGYLVETNGGKVWERALRIENRANRVVEDATTCNNNALVLIENTGDAKEMWKKNVDEQFSLERAKRACFRVDCLSLAVNFQSAFDLVLEFLADAGVEAVQQAPSTTTTMAMVSTTDKLAQAVSNVSSSSSESSISPSSSSSTDGKPRSGRSTAPSQNKVAAIATKTTRKHPAGSSGEESASATKKPKNKQSNK